MAATTKIAVLGATGPTGQQACKLALERGFAVMAVARNPDGIPADIKANPKFNCVKADVFSSESLAPHFKGVNAVVSCLGFHGFKPPGTRVDFYLDTHKAIVGAMKSSNVGYD